MEKHTEGLLAACGAGGCSCGYIYAEGRDLVVAKAVGKSDGIDPYPAPAYQRGNMNRLTAAWNAADGIAAEALTPGSIKALIDACQIALNHINYAGPDALMLDGTPAEEFARVKLMAALAPFEGAQEVKPNAESPA